MNRKFQFDRKWKEHGGWNTQAVLVLTTTWLPHRQHWVNFKSAGWNTQLVPEGG